MSRHDDSPNVGEDDLHALVDGQLDRERHGDVINYLGMHQDAADRVAGLMRQRVDLALLREHLGDSEPSRQVAQLTRELNARLHAQRRLRRTVGFSAMGLLLSAGLAGGLLLRGGAGPAAGPAAQTAQIAAPAGDPVAEAQLARLDPGDSAFVWLQAHLAGQSLKQPGFEALGLRLVGSSPLKGGGGPAVHLLYEDEKGREFHLFTGTEQSGAVKAATKVPPGHVSLSWRRDPLVFALIAPSDSPRLVDIMRKSDDLLDTESVAADASVPVSKASVAGSDHAAGERPGTAGLTPLTATEPAPLGSSKAL